jgi:hypothetical protein
MDLPNIEKGMRILAEDINRISREVRASAVTSFVGGRFTRSQAGTSLSLDPQYVWEGGETVNCPFKVTNESTTDTVRVKVQQNTVNTPSARWPQGMGPGTPDYYIPINETTYIYVKIIYVANEVIVGPEESDILIVVFPDIVENLVDWEFVLLAVVEYDGSKITKITNSCQNVTANPCNLKWS